MAGSERIDHMTSLGGHFHKDRPGLAVNQVRSQTMRNLDADKRKDPLSRLNEDFAKNKPASKLPGVPEKKSPKIANDVRISVESHGFKSLPTRRSGSLMRNVVKEQLMAERSEKIADNTTPDYVKFCRRVVESKIGIGFILIILIYVLTADDLRLIFTSRPADVVFNVLTAVCLVILILEIVLSSIGKDDYLMGFFFIMDMICTITMFLDFTAVSEALVVGDEENIDRFKTMKVATSHRMVRTCRQFRIIKLYKGILLSRRFAHKKSHRMDSEEDGNISPGEDAGNAKESDILGESQVGRKLAELTVRRVVLVVLVLTIFIPMCMMGLEKELPTSLSYGAEVVFGRFLEFQQDSSKRPIYERAMLQYLYTHNWFAHASGCEDDARSCPAHYYSSIFWLGVAGERENSVNVKSQLAQLTSGAVSAFDAAALLRRSMYDLGSMPAAAVDILSSPWSTTCNTGHIYRKGLSFLENGIPGFDFSTVRCPEDLRGVERTKYAPRFVTRSEFQDWHFAFYTDDRPFVKIDALCNLIATLFICLALWVQSLLHSLDASVLLLKPLEKMVLTVNMIRINPFMAKELAHDAEKREQLLKVRHSRLHNANQGVRQLRRMRRYLLCKPKAQTQVMETRILENTIVKLGLLLVLGFGEAGSNIVGRNLSKSDSAFVNAMVPGCQVQCIIGITRIRNFGIVTEVLANEVMTFVNKVAEIVHGMVDEYHGGANRMTIGDSFLLIWTMDGYEPASMSALADMSVVAFTRIYAEVHSSRALNHYHGHKTLQTRLGSMHPIDLSFGLHYGMAVEGAVGTEFKIDACYVSPNVSVAESIERSSETYGVNIMLTSSLMKLCTPTIKLKCRQIDCVIVRGCGDPMNLYCMDMHSKLKYVDDDILGMKSCETMGKESADNGMHLRYKADEKEKLRKWAPDSLEDDLSHCFVQAMREPFTTPFLQLFNMGYQNYSQGEWKAAKKILERTQHMLGFEDGPSSCLLRFMAKKNFEAGKDWKGHHALRFLEAATPGVETSQRASFVYEEVPFSCSDLLKAEALSRNDDWDAGSEVTQADVDKQSTENRVKKRVGQGKVTKKSAAKKRTSNTDAQVKLKAGNFSTPSTTASSLGGSSDSKGQAGDSQEPPAVNKRVTSKWKKSCAKVDEGADEVKANNSISTKLPMDDLTVVEERPPRGSRIRLKSPTDTIGKQRWTKSPLDSPTRSSRAPPKEEARVVRSFGSTESECIPLDIPEAVVYGTRSEQPENMKKAVSEKDPTKKLQRRTWKKGKPATGKSAATSSIFVANEISPPSTATPDSKASSVLE